MCECVRARGCVAYHLLERRTGGGLLSLGVDGTRVQRIISSWRVGVATRAVVHNVACVQLEREVWGGSGLVSE